MRKLALCIAIIIISIAHIEVDARVTPFVEQQKIKYGEDTIHVYEHEQTGLSVIWIENQDIKKSFTLGVKTPTVDSSGVNHIIEHSVFTGSKKYPSARLFFDACEAYPHIYMNASTSSDLTMYPFCTPYDVCFEGLLDIYLDSVLNPNLLNQPNSFYEEAFYYDPGKMQYGGVVYNEMLGANNNEGRMLFRKIREVLYEGEHYANDSGGDPEEITALTYETFVDTYKTYYTPSNMLIVLYGDLAINKTLQHIDKYLEGREQGELCDVNVPALKEDKDRTLTHSHNSQDYYIKSLQVNRDLTLEEAMMLDMWVDSYLVNTNSVFKQSLHEKGIYGVDVIKDAELKYPTYSIIISSIKRQDSAWIKKTVSDILEDTIKHQHDDTSIINDTLNKNKLVFYELDSMPTRGINIAEGVIRAWAHDGELFDYFELKDLLQQLDGISEHIAHILIEDVKCVDLMLYAEENDQPQVIKTMINDEEWKEICEDMALWQLQSESAPFDKINLNKLVIKNQLNPKVEVNKDIIYQLAETKGNLLSSELYLPTTHIPQEELSYLFLYSYMLEQAVKEMTPFEGGIATKVIAVDQRQGYTPYLKVNIMTDYENQNHHQLLEKAREELLQKDIKWYQSKLNQYIVKFSGAFQTDILGTLTQLNLAGQSGYKRYLYQTHYPFYEFCVQLKQEDDNRLGEYIQCIDQQIYPTQGASIAVTGEKHALKQQYKEWVEYCEMQYKEQPTHHQYTFEKLGDTNIYYHPTGVDYIMYNYDLEEDVLGAVEYLTCAYVTSNYLQPNIRIKKGAYGSSMCANFPDTLSIYTYRDPDYQTSLEIIDDMSRVLKEQLDVTKIERAKSGALSQFQNQFGLLASDIKQASIFHLLLLMNMEDSYLLKTQKDIIRTNKKEVENQIEHLEEYIQKSKLGICTNKRLKYPKIQARIYKAQ